MELNIVPNISCVANLGLVDIQVTLLGCQVDHHVQLYPFRSLKRWFALFEVQQVWEQFYLWPILLDINSIVKSSREGDYVHRRLWGTSHGSAVREVTFLIIGVKRAISCLLAIVSSTTSVHLFASLIPTTNQIPIISSSFDSIQFNQIINLNHTVILNLSQLTIRFVLVGATSFSLVDCESPFPNVFSRC